MKQTLLYLAYFVSIQLIAGYMASLFQESLVLATILANIIVVAVFLFLLRRQKMTVPTLMPILLSVTISVSVLLPSLKFQELMPQLTNNMEAEFAAIMKNTVLGYIAVAVLAPLAEELVFRGAILSALLRSRKLASFSQNHYPIYAICISAVLFALIHGNPAQMPRAFLDGLLLGWIVYRSGSLILAIILHWINNSLAFVLYKAFPDPNTKLVDIFGSQSTEWIAVSASLIVLVISILLFKRTTKSNIVGR